MKHSGLGAARATVIMTFGLSHCPEQFVRAAVFLICHSAVLSLCLACDAVGNPFKPIVLQNILTSLSAS